MQLIPTNQDTPVVPEAHTHADRMVFDFNAAMGTIVEIHKRGYNKFWNSNISPDDILARWGTQATKNIQIASQSFQNIAALAAIRGVSVDEFIPPSLYEPRRPYVFHPDGTVTLEEVFGHDAWGRFIPVPEDPQRTGYNDANEPTYGKYADGTDIMQPLPEGAYGYTADKELIYGFYNDETPVLEPVPEGVIGWTDAKEAIYGYEEDGVTPILVAPTPE